MQCMMQFKCMTCFKIVLQNADPFVISNQTHCDALCEITRNGFDGHPGRRDFAEYIFLRMVQVSPDLAALSIDYAQSKVQQYQAGDSAIAYLRDLKARVLR